MTTDKTVTYFRLHNVDGSYDLVRADYVFRNVAGALLAALPQYLKSNQKATADNNTDTCEFLVEEAFETLWPGWKQSLDQEPHSDDEVIL